MNNRSVETYLRKMIEIDQEALSVEGRIKEVEETKQKELRKVKRDLEMDILKRARMEARKEQEAVIKEAKEQEKTINQETEVELSGLMQTYKEAEDELLRSVISQMLKTPGYVPGRV